MTPQDTMRLALEALEDSHQNINPERGFADELEKQIKAAIEALKAALAQQGEQQPETWTDDGGWEFPIERPVRAYQEDYQCAEQQGEPAAWVFKNEYGITLSEGDCTALPDGVSTPLYAVAAPAAQPQCETARVLEWMRTPNRKAAQLAFTEGPERQAAYWIEIAQGEQAPQPTCKQDLQVPTVKENLTVETMQERYVRMCPDSECGRKKRCTRMVGVSCMSRADIAPTAQPDTWTDDGGWTFPVERQIIQPR